MNQDEQAQDRLGSPALHRAADRLREHGIRRIRSFAWRDLDDPEAGGSELHADEIMQRWARVGIDVEHRTSAAETARTFSRNNYWVVQRGTRYSVFPRVFTRELLRRDDPTTATLEIWNGVPWMSPLWGGPWRMVWMHHVHREMWADVLPTPLDRAGKLLETRLAPPFYRNTQMVTLSDSSRREILDLGVPDENLTVIHPGVHGRFAPDASRRSAQPLIVAVARLAPVKRVAKLLHAVSAVRKSIPDVRVEVIGDGPERQELAAWIRAHEAESWIALRGAVDDAGLVDAYQRAWLVASASHAEGWGMTLTEAAACGTPSVATDIAGHREAVRDGVTGDLVDIDDLSAAIVALLRDDKRRSLYGRAAREWADELSWDAVAARHLEVLLSTAPSS